MAACRSDAVGVEVAAEASFTRQLPLPLWRCVSANDGSRAGLGQD